MLPAPDLNVIHDRLQRIDFDPWGPDGIRYICILFWDDIGYRHLYNAFTVDDWQRWSHTSGEFWDLYLGGCYMYGPAGLYNKSQGQQPARPLAHGDPPYNKGGRRIDFLWSKVKSKELADEVSRYATNAHTLRPWTFRGPIELVAVGARRIVPAGIQAGIRRKEGMEFDIAIDWASLRAVTIRPSDVAEAVSYYTEAHITLNSDAVPATLPAPGDFHDDLLPQLKDDLIRRVPLIARLLARTQGL